MALLQEGRLVLPTGVADGLNAKPRRDSEVAQVRQKKAGVVQRPACIQRGGGSKHLCRPHAVRRLDQDLWWERTASSGRSWAVLTTAPRESQEARQFGSSA